MYNQGFKNWAKYCDFMVINLLCLQISMVTAYIFRHGFFNPYKDPLYFNMALVMMLSDIIVMIMMGTFNDIFSRGLYKEFFVTAKHVLIIEAISIFYLFVVQESGQYSRIVLVTTGFFFAITSYISNILWKKITYKIKNERYKRSILLVTKETNMEELINSLQHDDYTVFKIQGVVIIDSNDCQKCINGIPIIKSTNEILEFTCRKWIDEVLIDDIEDYKHKDELIENFSEMGLVIHHKISNSYDVTEQIQFVETINGIHVITSTINYATPLQCFIKRTIDITGSIVGLFLTAILFIIIAPCIYIKSPGPVFFSQTRVGKNGKKFKIYKFRSMYIDAEERKKDLENQNKVADGMMFKLDFDPRIIGSGKLPNGKIKKGIGNFIRDYSLDEFPQFLNVLKGDMSLVGTRPPTIDEWEKYELHHRSRMSVKPGITGMWQVSGRSNITSFEEVVKLDKKYIREWSLGLDIKILLKTVVSVIKKDGSM